MPVNQTSNNQVQADVISRYVAQRKQENTKPQQTQQQVVEKNNAPSEGVKVTLSKQGKAKATNVAANATAVSQQKPQETGNIESRQAIQAYQKTNKVTEREENNRPERQRERQIRRIVG
jgi:hypothetical protein